MSNRVLWEDETAESLTQQIREAIRPFPRTFTGEIRLSESDRSARWLTAYLLAPGDGPVMLCKYSANRALNVSDGDAVEVTGHWSFLWRSTGPSLVFVIDNAETIGPGTNALSMLRARLEAEGVFARKLSLPVDPQRVAVVSSATSAGVADFLARMETDPQITVRLFEVNLLSRQEVARGIARAAGDPAAFDLVAVVRGGGLQGIDLAVWASPEVANAIAHRQVPIITGIGHESDHTLADDLADQSLITPTAAAEWILQQRRHAIAQRIAQEQEQVVAQHAAAAHKARRGQWIAWIIAGIAIAFAVLLLTPR